MRVQMIGCSHHNSDVTFREKLAFQPTQAAAALEQMRRLFPRTEAVLLSTCNRMEIYTAAEDEADCPTAEQLINFVAEFHGLVPQDIAVELHNLSGDEAVRHLFSTAASLDSMVVGEAQILSQIKQAYDLANAGDSTGPLTHSTFQAAIRVAKRVQNETRLHEKRVSIPSIAVADYASQFFERFDDKLVLIIGAGEMAQETLTYLVDKNVGRIVIVNRNRERADQLAKQTGSDAADWDQLENLLAEADLVVSATASSEPVVTGDMFHQVVEKRYQRPIFILDLAVPRDFDNAISELINVYLYSIDDIHPGMFEVEEGGVSVAGEMYSMSDEIFQRVKNGEPSGLYFGDVKLNNGSTVKGVLFPRETAEANNKDISNFGDWRGYIASLKK